MKEKLETLIQLQAIETEFGQIIDSLDEIPGQLEALAEKQVEYQKVLDSEKELLEELKKKYRSMELDVQTKLSRMKQSQDKLSSVKNNKEYQALLKEIDEMKKSSSDIEDEMIACLEQMESAETELVVQEKNLTELKARVAAEKKALYQRADERKKRLAIVEEKQKQISEKVDPGLMASYKLARSRAGGLAVVPVLDAVCKGCHLNIPPQLYNDLQRGDRLIFCPHCDRILHWIEETETEL